MAFSTELGKATLKSIYASTKDLEYPKHKSEKAVPETSQYPMKICIGGKTASLANGAGKSGCPHTEA